MKKLAVWSIFSFCLICACVDYIGRLDMFAIPCFIVLMIGFGSAHEIARSYSKKWFSSIIWVVFYVSIFISIFGSIKATFLSWFGAGHGLNMIWSLVLALVSLLILLLNYAVPRIKRRLMQVNEYAVLVIICLLIWSLATYMDCQKISALELLLFSPVLISAVVVNKKMDFKKNCIPKIFLLMSGWFMYSAFIGIIWFSHLDKVPIFSVNYMYSSSNAAVITTILLMITQIRYSSD